MSIIYFCKCELLKWVAGLSMMAALISSTGCLVSEPQPEPEPEQPASSTSSVVQSSSMSSAPPVAQCIDRSQRPQINQVNWNSGGAPLTGGYEVIVEHDMGIAKHTVYRPALSSSDRFPVVAWGNGGCGANGLSSAEFLAEIASHGYVVVANGAPHGGGSDPDNGSTHIAVLDWAEDENDEPCSQYFDRLDMANTAAMGYSCGGLMSLNAGGDPRLTTVVAMNSGLLNPSQNTYASLHTPVAYFNGGPSDIAYQNGVRDYQSIQHVPVYHANLPVGHGGTYGDDNGGEFARVGTAWLNWHLKGDDSASGRGMFMGQNCGLCSSNWSVEHKNF